MDALSRQLDGVRLDSSPYGSARAFPASTDTPWLAAMDWNQTYTTTLEMCALAHSIHPLNCRILPLLTNSML